MLEGLLALFGQAVNLLGAIAEMNSVFLIAIMFVFMIIAYKVFQYVMRIVFVAVAFAAFPFVASLLGMNVPITLNSILNYAVLGVTLFFAYASIRTGIKVMRFVLNPFKGSFGRKEKVVIKEVEKEKE